MVVYDLKYAYTLQRKLSIMDGILSRSVVFKEVKRVRYVKKYGINKDESQDFS